MIAAGEFAQFIRRARLETGLARGLAARGRLVGQHVPMRWIVLIIIEVGDRFDRAL